MECEQASDDYHIQEIVNNKIYFWEIKNAWKNIEV
jgi:hypothetical protein